MQTAGDGLRIDTQHADGHALLAIADEVIRIEGEPIDAGQAAS